MKGRYSISLSILLIVAIISCFKNSAGRVERDDSMGNKSVRHNEGIRPTIRKRASEKKGKDNLSAKEAFARLWSIGMADVERVGLAKESYWEDISNQSEELETIKSLMKCVDYDLALLLFEKFHGKGASREGVQRYIPLASLLALDAVEMMAFLKPDRTLVYFEERSEMSDESVQNAIGLGWSEKDPRGAMLWWCRLERGAVDSQAFWHDWSVDEEVYRRFAKVDYIEARKLAGKAKYDKYRYQLYAAVISGLPDGVALDVFVRNELPKIVEGLPESEHEVKGAVLPIVINNPRGDIQRAMALRWVTEDTDAALDWYESVSNVPREELFDLDYLSQQSSGFLGDWAEKDADSFMKWAKKQGGEEHALGYYFGNSSEDIALEYIERMDRGNDRVDIAQKAIEQGSNSAVVMIFGLFAEGGRDSGLKRYYQKQIDLVSRSHLDADEKRLLTDWLETQKRTVKATD